PPTWVWQHRAAPADVRPRFADATLAAAVHPTRGSTPSSTTCAHPGGGRAGGLGPGAAPRPSTLRARTRARAHLVHSKDTPVQPPPGSLGHAPTGQGP